MQNLLEWNPQLFREFKGRLKLKNIAITSFLSIITQTLIWLYFQNFLRLDPKHYNASRYYLTQHISTPNSYEIEFIRDAVGNLVINWQLWWQDVYICLSVVSIFALLTIGVYWLTANLTQETSRGTLDFIRLSPQSASTILTGKILGVPICLYWAVLLAFPLQLLAGVNAHIPVSMLLGFALVLVVACIFFYSAALLFSLSNNFPTEFKPWLGSGVVLMFLLMMTGMVLSGYPVNNTPTDWLTLFYPGVVFPYLIGTADSSSGQGLVELLFYGKPLWVKASQGIGLVLLNYGLWSYWLWQGLERRFSNPNQTTLSKSQSYWFTGCFVAVALGFTLQTTEPGQLFNNFVWLQGLLVALFVWLILALSPQRQALQDWLRYRHQLQQKDRSVIKSLILAEKSPSTVAIALNWLIATVYILPTLIIFPLKHYSLPTLWGLLLGGNMILIYAVLAQWMLMMSNQKRTVQTAATLLSLICIPIVGLNIAGIEPQSFAGMWLFTALPTLATDYVSLSTVIMGILGQWLAIAIWSVVLSKQLRRAGASETKMLLSTVNQSSTKIIKNVERGRQ